MTFYRRWREEEGRVWFTWDKTQIFSFDDFPFWFRVNPLSEELRALGDTGEDPWDRAISTAQREGKTDVSRFYGSLQDYLSLSIQAAVNSDDPVIRGMATLDRRLGKRTLNSTELASETNPFVRRMLDLRREAEGLAPIRR